MTRKPKVFLVYMPPGNAEAMVHYHDTIENRIPLERVARYLPQTSVDRLRRIFSGRPMAIWGSRDGPGNRAKFARMSEGDDLLIVEGQEIKFMGKIALKVVSPELSHELWQDLGGGDNSGWDLIYFIANPVAVGVPFRAFCDLFEYPSNYRLRGLTSISDERLESFYDQFDDLYSILVRMRDGKDVARRPTEPVLPAPAPPAGEGPPPGTPIPLGELTDHTRM